MTTPYRLCFPADLESHAKQTNHVLEGLKHTTFSVNNSFSSMNVSVNSTLDLLVSHTEELDLRLKVLESHPREVLTKQIEDIHHEVRSDWCWGKPCGCPCIEVYTYWKLMLCSCYGGYTKTKLMFPVCSFIKFVLYLGHIIILM